MEKSSLVPSQTTIFLGIVLDTILIRVQPSIRRVEDVLELIGHFRLGKQLPYVTILQLLGKLTLLTCIAPLGLQSLRPL